jgi:hypothetical protein
MPLTLTLNGDAAIFEIMMAVELSPEVSHSDNCHWYTRRGWHVCN